MKTISKTLLVALFLVVGMCTLCFLSITADGTTGWTIDLFSQNGGQGQNVTSSPFNVGSEIILFAYVTYNGKPAQSVLVAFEVENPLGNPLLTTVQPTNSSGYATTNFIISQNNYPVFPSWWEAIATTSPSQNTVKDTMPFQVLAPLTVGGISSPIPTSIALQLVTTVFIEILIASVLIVTTAKFRGRHYPRAGCHHSV